MKKAVFATTVGRTITEGDKKRIERLAESKGANMIGVVEYPEMMPLVVPEMMVKKVCTCHADLMITDDPSFVISELTHDTSLYEQFKKENMEVYDLDTGLTMKEIISQLSDSMREQLGSANQSLKDIFVETIEQQKENVMFITKSEENTNLKSYIKEYAFDSSISSISTVNIENFEDFMCDPIKDITRQHDINKIIICDDYDSLKMGELMKEFETMGVEVTYANQEQNLSLQHTSLMMN